MFKHTLLATALACALPTPALAVSDADLAQLRAEFQQQLDQKLKEIQATYEARLKDLEARLAQTPAAVPAPDDQAARPPANSANPEVSLILQGSYAERKAGERRPTGFLQDGAIGARTRGFSLDDSELILAANIDPYFRGQAAVILADGQATVEEAWFQTLSLGQGLTLKGGRFVSGIGYQNEQHPHAWDFADNNLMYQTLFGEHLVQDGLQIKWLAPTDTFMEFGMEVGNGDAFPGANTAGGRNGAGSWAAFGHVGGDVGDANAWRAGLSWLSARPRERESLLLDQNGVDSSNLFSGRSRTWIADFVWKWAPDGNPKERNFKFQSEYFLRDEDGDLLHDPAGANVPGRYGARQSGWYAQGIWQFLPNWRAGLRYDRLDRGDLDFGANNAALLPAAYSPSKWSLMADYSPSEFSRLRLQLARDRSPQGSPDDSQVTLQYIHSLGPHGAHKF
jgi:hypothetical protein